MIPLAVYSLPTVAQPLAPPTPSGKPGAFGLWTASILLPDGGRVEAWGHGEQSALYQARRKACAELRRGKAGTP
jgi:hypothetical protein